MRPPRLISPRPTNSAGKRSSCGKADSSTSTYLGVAMLPSRTGWPPGPSASASDLASCWMGLQNSSAQGSIVRHQRSLDRTGGLNKGEFLAHRNVHRSEDETANPTIEGTG